MNKKPTEPMKPAQISLRKKAQARQRLRARVWLALVALCALIWLAIIGLVLHLTAHPATIGRHGQPAHLRPHLPVCAATPGQADVAKFNRMDPQIRAAILHELSNPKP